jgi:hypothetical protein
MPQGRHCPPPRSVIRRAVMWRVMPLLAVIAIASLAVAMGWHRQVLFETLVRQSRRDRCLRGRPSGRSRCRLHGSLRQRRHGVVAGRGGAHGRRRHHFRCRGGFIALGLIALIPPARQIRGRAPPRQGEDGEGWMTELLRHDICVIGAGAGGLAAAAGAAAFGVPVVLIEKARMHGDCLNYGCVPSKALIAAGAAAQETVEATVAGSHLLVAAGRVPQTRSRLGGGRHPQWAPGDRGR